MSDNKKIIKLKSRYDEDNYLKLMPKSDGSESKTYLLKTENIFISTGYNEDKKFFVDPSGGPTITVGKELEGIGVVKSIDLVYGYGYFITFE